MFPEPILLGRSGFLPSQPSLQASVRARRRRPLASRKRSGVCRAILSPGPLPQGLRSSPPLSYARRSYLPQKFLFIATSRSRREIRPVYLRQILKVLEAAQIPLKGGRTSAVYLL